MSFSPFPFLFLPHWSAWLLHSAAPAEATGAGMRSEREQLIKSSSTHKAESQFCSPSTVISFYLRVMSYGIFALGNTMSSINVFHLLHKQGQVIPASFYLHNQSNWLCCREREQGEQKRQNIRKKSQWFFFFYGSQHSGKTQMTAIISTPCVRVFVGACPCVMTERQLGLPTSPSESH